MIQEIISAINSTLKLPEGAVVNDIAESVLKGTEYSPYLIDKFGEGKSVAIDTTVPVIIYHKVIDVVCQGGKNGVGDDLGDLINTYNCSCIVYLNRKKTGLTPDELFLSIQNQFPSGMKFSPYKNIVIRVQRVILNSMQVWSSEYQGGVQFNLPADSNLFAINYQIESTFKKGCFVTC